MPGHLIFTGSPYVNEFAASRSRIFPLWSSVTRELSGKIIERSTGV